MTFEFIYMCIRSVSTVGVCAFCLAEVRTEKGTERQIRSGRCQLAPGTCKWPWRTGPTLCNLLSVCFLLCYSKVLIKFSVGARPSCLIKKQARPTSKSKRPWISESCAGAKRNGGRTGEAVAFRIFLPSVIL
jgi:hypothetical protein